MTSDNPAIATILEIDHSLITKHGVWKMMSNRQTITRLVELLPSEAYTEISTYARELSDQFSKVERDCLAELASISFDDPEEQILAQIDELQYPALVKAMMRGDDYAQEIWKIIEPETTPA